MGTFLTCCNPPGAGAARRPAPSWRDGVETMTSGNVVELENARDEAHLREAGALVADLAAYLGEVGDGSTKLGPTDSALAAAALRLCARLMSRGAAA